MGKTTRRRKVDREVAFEVTKRQQEWRCPECGARHHGFRNRVCRNPDCAACAESVKAELTGGVR